MNSLSAVLRTRPQSLKHFNHKHLAVRLLSGDVDEKIEIPRRIPRGPTDILRALESTIKKDQTAPHYKYHDDPFLIPMSNMGKRTFAMAQEAGRKAAHWVRQQNAELFQHREAEPPVDLFFPKLAYNEKSEVTEDDLRSVIKNVVVSEAAVVYNLLKERGISISPETQQDLLELLCYYNSENTLPEEFIEERWFRQTSKGKEKQRKTWKDGALAEEIFISIENPGTQAYAAIIQGMAKYFQVERAWQLFEEAQSKNVSLTTETYNALISAANFLKENYDQRWSYVLDMLSAINREKLNPTVHTLNVVLETLSTMGGNKNVKQNVLKTLAEFKKLNIEPCLTSWYFVLITFCKERGPISTILHDVLNEIQNKEHTIQDVRDTYFFATAMDICRHHLSDKDLAQRVDKLLNHGNNYNLIGDSFKESIYYRNYFILHCQQDPLDEFMDKVYNKYVPNIYVPEPAVMSEILKSVELNAAVEYLPKLWSDMVVFDHTGREELLTTVLDLMINKKMENQELTEQFSKVAWDIWDKIENQNPNRIQKLTFTGEMLGNIMTLVLNNGEFGKACEVMEKLDKGHHVILGVPKVQALAVFIDNCIVEKLPSRAISCIQYCSDSGYPETDDLARKLNKSLTLDETHLGRLSKIVGDIFSADTQKSEEAVSKS